MCRPKPQTTPCELCGEPVPLNQRPNTAKHDRFVCLGYCTAVKRWFRAMAFVRCETCGLEFWRTKRCLRDRIACSRPCMKSRLRHDQKPCRVCGTVNQRNRDKRHEPYECDGHCAAVKKWFRLMRLVTCGACSKPFWIKKSRLKPGAMNTYCSDQCCNLQWQVSESRMTDNWDDAVERMCAAISPTANSSKDDWSKRLTTMAQGIRKRRTHASAASGSDRNHLTWHEWSIKERHRLADRAVRRNASEWDKRLDCMAANLRKRERTT